MKLHTCAILWIGLAFTACKGREAGVSDVAEERAKAPSSGSIISFNLGETPDYDSHYSLSDGTLSCRNGAEFNYIPMADFKKLLQTVILKNEPQNADRLQFIESVTTYLQSRGRHISFATKEKAVNQVFYDLMIGIEKEAVNIVALKNYQKAKADEGFRLDLIQTNNHKIKDLRKALYHPDTPEIGAIPNGMNAEINRLSEENGRLQRVGGAIDKEIVRLKKEAASQPTRLDTLADKYKDTEVLREIAARLE